MKSHFGMLPSSLEPEEAEFTQRPVSRNAKESSVGSPVSMSRRSIGYTAWREFSEGLSVWSITRAFSGAFVDSSFRPSCSLIASRNVVP
jgi:hypothetical protein